MAKELADAIVEASIIMQKKEEEEEADVAAYLTGYSTTSLVLRPVNSSHGYAKDLCTCYNYFEAIQKANELGYRLMQGEVAKKLLQRASTVHKENGWGPVYALFEKKA